MTNHYKKINIYYAMLAFTSINIAQAGGRGAGRGIPQFKLPPHLPPRRAAREGQLKSGKKNQIDLAFASYKAWDTEGSKHVENTV